MCIECDLLLKIRFKNEQFPLSTATGSLIFKLTFVLTAKYRSTKYHRPEKPDALKFATACAVGQDTVAAAFISTEQKTVRSIKIENLSMLNEDKNQTIMRVE